MQALHLLALVPVAETTGDPNSYGFRSGRSTADAIEQCFRGLCHKSSAGGVLEGDIRGCFDFISHEWMLNHIPTDTEVLRKQSLRDRGLQLSPEKTCLTPIEEGGSVRTT